LLYTSWTNHCMARRGKAPSGAVLCQPRVEPWETCANRSQEPQRGGPKPAWPCASKMATTTLVGGVIHSIRWYGFWPIIAPPRWGLSSCIGGRPQGFALGWHSDIPSGFRRRRPVNKRRAGICVKQLGRSPGSGGPSHGYSPDGAALIPRIFFIQFNTVPTAQFAEFVFKRPSAMMFRLVFNVRPHLRDVRFADAKRAISRLPCETPCCM